MIGKFLACRKVQKSRNEVDTLDEAVILSTTCCIARSIRIRYDHRYSCGAFVKQFLFAKPMIPIAGKPLLEYVVRLLARHGFDQLAINLSHLPHIIRDHFGDGRAFGVKITYSFEEQLLGTAGAVRRLAAFFDEPFLVYYGDNLSNADLNGADLQGLMLNDANLVGADLSGHDLSGTQLYGARLDDADLSSADLSSADLRHANLTNANLDGANLTFTNFESAHLTGVNFKNSLFNSETEFPNGYNINSEDAVFIEPKIMTFEDFLQTDLSSVDLNGSVQF